MKLKNGILKLNLHDLDHILPDYVNNPKKPISYYFYYNFKIETIELHGYKMKNIDKIEINISEFDVYNN